jgi:hypothetical protein
LSVWLEWPVPPPLEKPKRKPDQLVPGLWAAAISGAKICWLTAAGKITALAMRSLFN